MPPAAQKRGGRSVGGNPLTYFSADNPAERIHDVDGSARSDEQIVFRTVKGVALNDGRTAQIHDGGFIICQRDAATAEAFGDLVARDRAAAHPENICGKHTAAAGRAVACDHAAVDRQRRLLARIDAATIGRSVARAAICLIAMSDFSRGNANFVR